MKIININSNKNMKTNKNIISVFALIVLFSCTDFLDEKAFDTYTTSNFPVSDEDAEALVNQMYNEAAQAYGNRLLFISELPSEMVTTRRTGADSRAQLDEYTVLNANDYLIGAWADNYQTIKQANAVIELYGGGETNINPELADRLTGEALFLRANSYFNLATYFGDVPLILNRISTLESAENAKSPLVDIYQAIIEDLIRAEPLLPHFYERQRDLGRATKGAARALLGKVYLQWAADPRKDVANPAYYTEALNWLRKVRDQADGGHAYTLEPKYNNLFGLENVESAKFSNENVFQFWRDLACCANGNHAHLNALNSDFGSAGWGNLAAEIPFYMSFENNDDRFAVTFLDTIVRNDGRVHIYDVTNPMGDGFEHTGAPFQKWVDPNAPGTLGGNNIFVIRYADVLLMIAEAANEVSAGPTPEAYEAINMVRARARSTPEALPDYSNLDYNAFRESVFNERRWELAFECHGLRDGHRFLDIFKERVEANSRFEIPPVPEGKQRNSPIAHDGVPSRPITITDDKLRMPVPLREIDSNPLIDN